MSRIADASLAAEGQRRIDWAWQHMPVLQRLSSELSVAGRRIALRPPAA